MERVSSQTKNDRPTDQPEFVFQKRMQADGGDLILYSECLLVHLPTSGVVSIHTFKQKRLQKQGVQCGPVGVDF